MRRALLLCAAAWASPRGGSNDLALEDFAKAVAYMARQAGGEWQDPDTAMLAKIRAEAQAHRHGEH